MGNGPASSANERWGCVIISPGCSNKCFFCGPSSKKGRSEMRVQEVKVLKNLIWHKGNGINRLEISGADPIEYEKITSLIRYVKGLFEYVQLSTHGRRLSDGKFLHDLAGSGLDRLRIPIYGARPETHDSVTGAEGSFLETVGGIKSLKKRCPTINLQVSCLVTEQNKDELIGIVKLARGLRADSLYFSVPCVANGDYSSYVPLKDLGPYVRKVLDYSERNGCDVDFMEIPFCVFGRIHPSINNMCPPPSMGKYCQPPEHERSQKKDVPLYRLKKKVGLCESCACSGICDGFFVNDVDVFGVGGLEPLPRQGGFLPIKNGCYILDFDGSGNQKCLFCMKSKSIEGRPMKTKDAVFAEIAHAVASGCERIDFFGGEPTTYPFLPEAISYARSLGLTISLATNAVAFSSNDYARRVLGDGFVFSVRTSLHSNRPCVHDRITQVGGSWGKTVAGIRNILRYNDKLSVNVVINSLNFRDLERIVIFLHSLGVRWVKFSRIVPKGRLLENKHLCIDYETFRKELIGSVRMAKKLGFSYIEMENMPRSASTERCMCGVKFLA